MNRPLILNREGVVALRDPRYAHIWELGGPKTGLSALSIALVVVDAGAASPRHWHEATEEAYVVVSGNGIVHLGGAKIPVAPGDAISIPIGIVHAIEALGTENLTMWVMTSPPYDDNDDFEVESS